MKGFPIRKKRISEARLFEARSWQPGTHSWWPAVKTLLLQQFLLVNSKPPETGLRMVLPPMKEASVSHHYSEGTV